MIQKLAAALVAGATDISIVQEELIAASNRLAGTWRATKVTDPPAARAARGQSDLIASLAIAIVQETTTARTGGKDPRCGPG